MADIYFHPQWPTNGSGTEANPRNVWPTSIGAGDYIYVRPGTQYTHTGQMSFGAGSNVTVMRQPGYEDATDPEFTILSSSFGAFNAAAAGVNTIQDIAFVGGTNTTNGAILVSAAVSGTTGCALRIIRGRFTGTLYNAIRLNVSGANSAPTFYCEGTTFDDIGEDAIYGGAFNYRIYDTRMTRLSSRTSTGDGIGFFDTDPTFVHIRGNHIDHSGVDSKQCIIIDTQTGPSSAIAIIEDNTLIGYGSDTDAPSAHTIAICDIPLRFLRNDITTYGAAIGTNFASDEISGNIIRLRNRDSANSTIAINATGSRVDNNTIIGHSGLAATTRAVVMGGAASSASVRNNVFVNVPIAIKSDSVGNNPTATNNCFYGVTSQRLDSSSAAFTGGNDVTADPVFNTQYMPQSSSVRSSGVYLGGGDFYGKTFGNTPTIGAVQYQAARSLTTRTVGSRSVASRDIATRRVITV